MFSSQPSLWWLYVSHGIFVVKVYFLLWVYLCGLDGAPQVWCVLQLAWSQSLMTCMDIINKPVIVWWACAPAWVTVALWSPYYYQMSFQAAASPTGAAPPPPLPLPPPLLSKTSIARRRRCGEWSREGSEERSSRDWLDKGKWGKRKKYQG